MSDLMTAEGQQLKHILEAALLAADEPLSQARLAGLFPEDERPSNADIGMALEAIAESCADRGVELKEVASGFRLQVKTDLQPWVARLWTDKPQKYSRAMLETLSLIAYRQPITRGEIESVRGVSLSSNIIRSLQEREWIRIVGHRDVPGKPALFGTTRAFLDYFDLASLDELPTLAEIKDMDTLEPELELDPTGDGQAEDDGEAGALDALPAAANDDKEASDTDGETNETELSADEGETLPDQSLEDHPVDDEEFDAAFEELDQAFHHADDIDLGEDDPAPDEGVDPESPQADLVAQTVQDGDASSNDPGVANPDSVEDAEAQDDEDPDRS
jgi:segregation and condensation protein B